MFMGKVVMEDSLLFYFLIGMLGNDIARHIVSKDKDIKISLFLLFSLIFSTVYITGLLFFVIVYFLAQFSIPWQGLGVFSFAFSFCASLLMWLLQKIR